VLGFAPHPGWAVVVMLGDTAAAPRLLARERIALTEEEELEGSKQPYHALEGLPLAEARRRLERFEAQATRLAVSALCPLAERAHSAGAGRAGQLRCFGAPVPAPANGAAARSRPGLSHFSAAATVANILTGNARLTATFSAKRIISGLVALTST
jgi:hypothetical protein